MSQVCVGDGERLSAGRNASSKPIHLARWLPCSKRADGLPYGGDPKGPVYLSHTHNQGVCRCLRKLTVTNHHPKMQNYELTKGKG